MRVALVNTNRIEPPIAPIGLDYVAEALHAAGHQVDLLDLCWETDAGGAVRRFFARTSYELAGLTLRNTDNCGYKTRQSLVPALAGLIETIRGASAAKILLGGVGFSVMPEAVLEATGADAGIWGEGEFALPELATRMEQGEEWRETPNLVWKQGAEWRRNAPAGTPLEELPPMTRRWVDNRRYFHWGGQAGFETKRGCGAACVYCADPLAKGARTRVRPAAAVADELECLAEQGVDHLHTCDAEFNMPPWHALEVCHEITRRGLDDKLRWYAYCAPAPFSKELARAMRDAGCVGINFGADSGDAAILKRLGRAHGPEDILKATEWSKGEGMAVMLDLLLGSPGESRESLIRTVELMRQAGPDCVGVSVGVWVMAGTPLAKRIECPSGEPTFFVEPAVEPFVFDLLDSLIGNDARFLFFDPRHPERNYNYIANQRLVDAIRSGRRGAYWDILRRPAQAS